MAGLLNRFPYEARWLYWLSVVVFCLNIALFAFFIFVSILQYALYPVTWRTLPSRPNQALYLSAIPTVIAFPSRRPPALEDERTCDSC